jgi:MFS family permease
MTPASIWLICAVFFTYTFIARLAPGVLAPDLMEALALDGSGLSSLSSLTLFTYASSQIPFGILTDQWGPKKMLLFSIGLTALSTLLFGISTEIEWVFFSRLLCGLGTASGFLIISKVTSIYMERSKAAVLLGFAMIFGTLGSILAGPPLGYLATHTSWRHTLVGVALLGVPLFLVALKLPKSAEQEAKQGLSTWEASKALFRQSRFWLLCLLAVFIYLPINLFDAWGVPILMKWLGTTSVQASQFLASLYIGLAVGSFGITALASKGFRVEGLLLFSNIILFVFLLLFAESPGLPLASLLGLLFTVGFFVGAEILCYSESMLLLSPQSSGLISGILNTVAMGLGGLVQYLMGSFLDQLSASSQQSGFERWAIEDFQVAMRALAFSFCVSCVLSVLLFFVPRKRNAA